MAQIKRLGTLRSSKIIFDQCTSVTEVGEAVERKSQI